MYASIGTDRYGKPIHAYLINRIYNTSSKQYQTTNYFGVVTNNKGIVSENFSYPHTDDNFIYNYIDPEDSPITYSYASAKFFNVGNTIVRIPLQHNQHSLDDRIFVIDKNSTLAVGWITINLQHMSFQGINLEQAWEINHLGQANNLFFTALKLNAEHIIYRVFYSSNYIDWYPTNIVSIDVDSSGSRVMAYNRAKLLLDWKKMD